MEAARASSDQTGSPSDDDACQNKELEQVPRAYQRGTCSRSEHVRLELAQLRRLEVASLVEATTLILLVGMAVPLRHLFGRPAAVTVMGPVHGLAFVAYIWTVLQTVADGGWRRPEWLRLVATAFVPFAGYTNLPLIRHKAKVLALAPARAR